MAPRDEWHLDKRVPITIIAALVAQTLFFTYIGFDAVSTLAEESKNPQRDLPRGMFYSLLICTIL